MTSSGMSINWSWLTSCKMSGMGKIGARSSGPTISRPNGCRQLMRLK